MQIKDAIIKISDIHDQLLKTEVYRGFRASHMIIVGAIACAGSFFQHNIIGDNPGLKFIYYWLFIAVISGGISAVFLFYNYYFHKSYLTRKKTPQIMRQFFPGITAGAMITAGIIAFQPESITLLPGLWSICFAVSIFSIIPYFIQSAVWVALYYFIFGFILLYLISIGKAFEPWGMGATFGGGHIILGIMIFITLEKTNNEKNSEF